MILIEIFSDSNELFRDVPSKHHKKLIKLYTEGIVIAKSKPQLVKLISINLIKLHYIKKKFRGYDVKKLLDDFTKFYLELEKNEKEKIKIGFLDDLEEIIFEYLDEKN